MTELTQTQERKLWASIINGDESNVKWHEVLTAFLGLDLNRQKATMKRIPIPRLMTLKDLLEKTVASRGAEIAKQQERLNAINDIKNSMKDLGVTISDLGGSEPEKFSDKPSQDNISKEQLLKVIEAKTVNGIAKISAADIADEHGGSLSNVYALLVSLQKEGKIVKLSRGSYQIIHRST